MIGAFPAVQWLRFRLPVQGVQVQSLVRELRSHMLSDVVEKKKKSLMIHTFICSLRERKEIKKIRGNKQIYCTGW